MTASVTSLVRRAQAGEVNARDELALIGAGETPGYGVLQRVRASMSRFGEALFPSSAEEWEPHPEDGKPELPPNALSGLKSPETFVRTIIACHKFKDGTWACAIIVASGPSLNARQVHTMARSMNFSGTQARCFAHAVQFPDDASCRKLAASVGPAERCAIVAGQCVGRARQLQAARSTSRMGVVHPVIGWEMGEP